MSERIARPFTREEMEMMRRGMKDEQQVRQGFWAALKRVAGYVPFAEDLVAAYFCAIDPRTPRRVRYILFGALGYFIMPFDAISDFLPLIGFADDAAVLAAAIAMVSSSITAEHRDKARQVLKTGSPKAV